MREETINVYSYDELNEEAKERVRNDLMNLGDFLYNGLADELDFLTRKELEKNKIKIVKDNEFKVYYSLSHRQGDGIQFNGVFEWMYRKKEYTVKIKQSWHYYHSNCVNLFITDSDTGDEATEEVYKCFKNIFDSICEKVEKQGYKFISSCESEENISELCINNEFEFLENGEGF